MAQVRYRKLTSNDLVEFRKAAKALEHLQTEVKPFSSEYVAILEMKTNLNVLAASAGADVFFAPAAPGGAY